MRLHHHLVRLGTNTLAPHHKCLWLRPLLLGLSLHPLTLRHNLPSLYRHLWSLATHCLAIPNYRLSLDRHPMRLSGFARHRNHPGLHFHPLRRGGCIHHTHLLATLGRRVLRSSSCLYLLRHQLRVHCHVLREDCWGRQRQRLGLQRHYRELPKLRALKLSSGGCTIHSGACIRCRDPLCQVVAALGGSSTGLVVCIRSCVIHITDAACVHGVLSTRGVCRLLHLIRFLAEVYTFALTQGFTAHLRVVCGNNVPTNLHRCSRSVLQGVRLHIHVLGHALRSVMRHRALPFREHASH
mmetsp:Transcript_45257/g.76270  ORF Transcript_45257/g.76270 Transcript_45257/m.76270 type:complete len:296 (+) Transcript_45257:1101-1988(+)